MLLDNNGGNVGPRVLVTGWSVENAIGDTTAGAGNIVAFNVGDGVLIVRDSLHNVPDPVSNHISRNAIYANGMLGINLVGGIEDGKGQTFLGSTVVRTNASGLVSFNTTIGIPVSAGRSAPATATDPMENTSDLVCR